MQYCSVHVRRWRGLRDNPQGGDPGLHQQLRPWSFQHLQQSQQLQDALLCLPTRQLQVWLFANFIFCVIQIRTPHTTPPHHWPFSGGSCMLEKISAKLHKSELVTTYNGAPADIFDQIAKLSLNSIQLQFQLRLS